jgi:hypothetical protein
MTSSISGNYSTSVSGSLANGESLTIKRSARITSENAESDDNSATADQVTLSAEASETYTRGKELGSETFKTSLGGSVTLSLFQLDKTSSSESVSLTDDQETSSEQDSTPGTGKGTNGKSGQSPNISNSGLANALTLLTEGVANDKNKATDGVGAAESFLKSLNLIA